MKLAEKRPAALICGVFVIVSFVSVYFVRSPIFYALLASAVTALVFLFIYSKGEDKLKKRVIIAVTIVAITVSVLNVCINEFYKIPRIREFADNDPVKIRGVVVTSFSEDDHIKYSIDADEISGRKVSFRILVEKFGNTSSFDELYLPGDVISCKAVISSIDGGDGYWYHYCADGIYVSADPENIELIKSGEGTLSRFIFDVTEFSKKYADSYKNGAFVRAVLFGDKSLVSDEFKENINNAGLSHYLAVSGLHLTLIIGGIFSFFKLLGVHRRVNSCISVLLCVVYMAICGFSPSAVRAGVMLIMYNISVIMRRDADVPTSLCIASFLMIAIDPECIYDIGFKLSFASALGIVVGAVPYNKYIGEKKIFNSDNVLVNCITKPLLAVINALVITVCAVVFSFPFLLTEFRYINILSPVYNLIITVIFTPMMYFILGSVALYAASDMFSFTKTVLVKIAELLGDASDMLIDALEYLINIFGSFSEAVMYAGVYATLAAAAVFAVLFFIFAFKRIHVKYYPVLPLTVLLTVIASSCIFYFVTSERLSVYNISDRTDEKIIMRYKNDVIIGELKTKGYYTSKRTLENIVYDKGITSVDGYFIAEYSDKLYDQLQIVCRVLAVEKVCLPYPSDESEKDIFLSIFELCSEKGIELERFSFGRKSVCESFEITFEKLTSETKDKFTGYEMNVTAGNKTELLYTSCSECFESSHGSDGDILLHLESSPVDDMKYEKKFYSGDIIKKDVYDKSVTYVAENTDSFGFHVYKETDKDNFPKIKTVSDD